jgi:sugar phosphate permease
MTTEQQAYPVSDPTLAAASRRAAKRLIWFLGVLYFINYLDRTNISFAGPNGMNQDLGLTQTMFGLASGVFFIGYLLLEVPSNMALHRFGARRWIARIMVVTASSGSRAGGRCSSSRASRR